jgi:hypothetical protein
MSDIVRCFCNSCNRDTSHDVVWNHIVGIVEGPYDPPDYHNVTEALRCRGCGECTIRHQKVDGPHDFAEPVGDDEIIETIYKPARLWRRPPDWVKSLEDRDPDLKALLDEVYSATNDTQVRLLSMGVRTALDYVMVKIIGDVGSFEQKLDKMVADEHLSKRQKENLSIVIDAGSASTHRGFKPSRDLLEEMVTVMEGIIRDHYITGPMLNTAKLQIPPRPPRPSRSKQ